MDLQERLATGFDLYTKVAGGIGMLLVRHADTVLANKEAARLATKVTDQFKETTLDLLRLRAALGDAKAAEYLEQLEVVHRAIEEVLDDVTANELRRN